MHLVLSNIYLFNVHTKIVFGQIMGNSPEIIHFETDLDPEPEKLSGHGACVI